MIATLNAERIINRPLSTEGKGCRIRNHLEYFDFIVWYFDQFNGLSEELKVDIILHHGMN